LTKRELRSFAVLRMTSEEEVDEEPEVV